MSPMQVHRTPHVAVLSTGDELVPAETGSLEPGRIRDANRPMLLAAGALLACALTLTLTLTLTPTPTLRLTYLVPLLRICNTAVSEPHSTEGGSASGCLRKDRCRVQRHPTAAASNLRPGAWP